MLVTAVINATLRPKRTIRDGTEYLVAPAVLLIEGVLNGSRGPLYYPAEEIEANPLDWAGMPIVVYHPFDTSGNPISANSQQVLDSQGVGFVADPVASAGRLRAKLWFDIEKTRRVDNRVLLALQHGQRLELSTGLGTHNYPAEPGATDAKGRTYNAIARDYAPDHLAVLPDEVGACSIRDGCGVLVNCNSSTCTACTSREGYWNEVRSTSPSWSPLLTSTTDPEPQSSPLPTIEKPLATNSSTLDDSSVIHSPSTGSGLVSNPMGKWKPPEAGPDAPAEIKRILRKVYAAYRNKNPQETAAVKAKGAKIAWAAVHKAGWEKDEEGKWHKVTNNMQQDWVELETINLSSDMSLDELEHCVRCAFRAANPTKYDPDTGMAIDPKMVVSIFPDYLIFMENWEDLYRQSYSIDSDGAVTLDNDIQAVRRTTAYVPIESAAS